MRCLGWIVGLGLAASAGAQTMTEFGAAAAGGTVGGAAGKKVSDGLTNIFGKVDQQTKAAAKAAKEDPAKADKPAETPAAAITAGATSSSPAPAPAASSNSGPASNPGPSSNPSPSLNPGPAPKPAPAKKAVSAKVVPASAKRAEPPSVPDPPALPSRPAVLSKASEPRPQQPRPVVEVAPIVPPPPPPPPEVTAENLRDIAPGAAREDVLKLGIPAARITMFGDDGHLLEIYSYRAKNTTFGVVRLSDGAVSKVELR
jgi:hypothetical protein